MLNESKKPTNQKNKCKKKEEHNAAAVILVAVDNDDSRYNINIEHSAVSPIRKTQLCGLSLEVNSRNTNKHAH